MKNNSDHILFEPSLVAQQSIKIIKQRMGSKDKGVLTGFDPLDTDLNPFIPGDLGIVIARPSNFKTSFMLRMAGNEAKKIVDEGLDDQIIVYITWEIAVEEAGIMDLCALSGVDMNWVARGMITEDHLTKLRTSAVDRMNVPIWVIGHSLLHRKKRPGLTLSDVALALKKIEDIHKKKTRLIMLDYLQKITPERTDERERRLQVSRAVDRTKDMALALGCPVVLACQAKRDVDDRRFKLPGMSDGMDTSAIEHTGDKIVSLWMPHTSHDHNLKEYEGYTIAPRTLIVGLVKQRYGISQKTYLAEVNFRTREIFEARG